MHFILSLLNSFPYIDFPFDAAGWVGLAILLSILIAVAAHFHEPDEQRDYGHWVFFIILIITAPLVALFLGVRLPGNTALPLPGLPAELSAPVVMIFSALPWVLAGGILGPVFAVAVASVSGLFTAFWGTHTIFTIIEYAGMALFFSLLVRQRYRTTLFRFLRHPLGSGILLPFVYAPVVIVSALFSTPGGLAVRMDHALIQTWWIILTRGVELVIACGFAEVLYLLRIQYWGKTGALKSSPAETSLSARFIFAAAPLIGVIVIIMLLGDWVVAGRASRRLVEDRLSSTSLVAAESLPYFLESGQNLISSFASQDLIGLSPLQLQDILSQRIRSIPYFRGLYLFDENGIFYSGYPEENTDQVVFTSEELAGVQLSIKGVSVQTYTLPYIVGEDSALITFLSRIKDDNGNTRGVLVGRTDLQSNPFSQAAIEAIGTMSAMGGDGLILDENNNVIYHSSTSSVMDNFYGDTTLAQGLSEEISSVGTRQLVYYQPVTGRPWAVILRVPATVVQQMSLQIAVPLLAMLLFLLLAGAFLWLFLMQKITFSLHSLAKEATLIARGHLDHELKSNEIDEIGQLANAFEQMRLSLKARLEELGSLLHVSQGVATHLTAEQAITPILQVSLSNGSILSRVVMPQAEANDHSPESVTGFGVGPASDHFAYLDRQIYDLMAHQDVLTIRNTNRLRRLKFEADYQPPGALMAHALRHEDRYLGALWIAYRQPRNFSDEEVQFVRTLTSQAALAASNARLYASAEIGRQRLEAILSSTPEPVLVVDENARLLLLNPAALQVPGLIVSARSGAPISEVVTNKDVLEFIQQPILDRVYTREVIMNNGRIYYVSAAPVFVQGQPAGKICLMRDITYYKELDTIKSEFVSTVSHDLRSPLTLMRGYATMLEMVGELNEQQKNYVRRIIAGVEGMSRLVGNLLDLGRIETGIGLKITRVRAMDIVEKVLNTLEPQAIHKNIQVITPDQSHQVIILEADFALLQQALYNLIENSIKYTPIGGTVEVKLHVREHSLIFEIDDNGIGIAPIDLPHLFEKFYRSSSREVYRQRGTGLGLAIVKSIAERHGGKVWGESQLGKGSKFYMEIPLKQNTHLSI